MKCLILASGFATRLYPLTLTRAKPLLVYRGRPLLSHLVDCLPADLDITVTVNRKFEKDFRAWQETAPRKVELLVEEVWNERQSLGAIGSLSNAITRLSIREDILALAGDNYFEFSIPDFIRTCNGVNTLLAVYDIGSKEAAKDLGVLAVEGSKVVEFEEKPARPKSSLVATGCYILPARIFPILEDYCASHRRDNLGDFIRHLVEEDEVHAWSFQEEWLDIGSAFSPLEGNSRG